MDDTDIGQSTSALGTFTACSNPDFEAVGPTPRINFEETDGTATETKYSIRMVGGMLDFKILTTPVRLCKTPIASPERVRASTIINDTMVREARRCASTPTLI